MSRIRSDVGSVVLVAMVACTSTTGEPVVTGAPPSVTANVPLPGAEPSGAPMASAAPSPVASATPGAPPLLADATGRALGDNGEVGSAKTTTSKDKLKSAGHPLAIYAAPTQPVTVGRDGAVVRAADGAELRILADSLAEPRNVLVIVDRGARGTKGKVGDVYDLPVQIPAHESKIGAFVANQPYESSGAPFILKIPLPNGVKSANLAVERVTSDSKTKKISSTWTVLPVSKIESGGSGDKAVFELKALPGTHVHLTSLPPEEPGR